jgi:hypothetical protein
MPERNSAREHLGRNYVKFRISQPIPYFYLISYAIILFNIIVVIRSVRMGWTRHVASMRDEKYVLHNLSMKTGKKQSTSET